MYGVNLRNALYLAFGALFAAVVERIISPFLPILKPVAEDTAYYNGLEVLAGADNVLLIIILALVFGTVTRAIVEGSLAGVRR